MTFYYHKNYSLEYILYTVALYNRIQPHENFTWLVKVCIVEFVKIWVTDYENGRGRKKLLVEKCCSYLLKLIFAEQTYTMSVHKLSLVRSFFVSFSPSPKLALQYTQIAIFEQLQPLTVQFDAWQKSSLLVIATRKSQILRTDTYVLISRSTCWDFCLILNLHTGDNLNWGNTMPFLHLNLFKLRHFLY